MKLTEKQKELSNLQELEVMFGEDTDLLLFYVAWLKNGLDAKAAYKELHPNVTDYSAKTLGSRTLKKVDRSLLLEAYGLDLQKYFTQLAAGLDAKKVNEFTGEMFPDHTTRKPYHDKLGKILGIEKDKALMEFNQQVNNFVGWDAFMEMMKKRKEEQK